ncbi:MAG: hypothetical protein KF812_03335 [Fimbriimonadaceae bacterium]|nr:hypothetical protein [Fimbriimonadaceae bacterium]
MIAKNRDLRGLAIAPLLISGLVLIVVWVVAVAWGGGALGAWAASFIPWAGGASTLIARLIVGIGLLFLASSLFIHFALMAGGHYWDELSFRVEQRVMGNAPREGMSLARLVLEIAMRLVFALFIALVGLLFGWWLAGVVGVILAGSLAFIDLTAPAFARRGVRFPRQVFAALALKEKVWFVPLAGLIALVPLLNIFLLPGLLSTATIIVARRHPQ